MPAALTVEVNLMILMKMSVRNLLQIHKHTVQRIEESLALDGNIPLQNNSLRCLQIYANIFPTSVLLFGSCVGLGIQFLFGLH